MRTGRGRRTRRRWVRWALGTCVVLAAIGAALWFAAPWYVRTRVLPRLWAQYALTVSAEEESVSIADGRVVFRDVRILDGEEELLNAKHLAVRVSLRGLYEGHTVFESIVIEDPTLRLHRDADGRTNLGKILERSTGKEAPARPATLWEDVAVHRGTLDWDDPANGVSLRLLDIEASVLDMQTGRGETQDRFGQITIDADVEQPGREPALLSIVHWTAPSPTPGPTFVAHIALTGIDLDAFPVAVDATQRAALDVDHLDAVVSMDVFDGVVRRGVAVAVSPERTRPLTLLFGGPFEHPVFDRSSSLVALWELPFSRLGRVGDVVWDTGGAIVGGAIGLVDGVVHGDLLAAGRSVIEGTGGGVLALGGHALDVLEDLGRGLGLVAQAEERDIVAIHDRQRAAFLAARLEATRAWSRRHTDPLADPN